jgi:hypothetical protein
MGIVAGLLEKAPEWYVAPQETWDKARCHKAARHLAKDGLGTPYGWRGLIQPSGCIGPRYGRQCYNGGYTGPDGQYYRQGYIHPYPKLHEDYVYVHRCSWGIFIMLKADVTDEKVEDCATWYEDFSPTMTSR